MNEQVALSTFLVAVALFTGTNSEPQLARAAGPHFLATPPSKPLLMLQLMGMSSKLLLALTPTSIIMAAKLN
jgi:hypothetical protein